MPHARFDALFKDRTKTRKAQSSSVRAARAIVTAARRVSRRPRVSNVRTGGLLGLERKFFDTSNVADALAATTDMTASMLDPATLLGLNVVAQGDGASERDGRKISMTSIMVTGEVTRPSASAQTAMVNPGIVTLYLVLDTQTNAAQTTSQNIFVNPSADVRSNPGALRNLEFSNRYRVLAKWTRAMPQQTTGNDAAGTFDINGVDVPFTLSANLKRLETHYKIGGTTSVIANIVDNSIHLVG